MVCHVLQPGGYCLFSCCSRTAVIVSNGLKVTVCIPVSRAAVIGCHHAACFGLHYIVMPFMLLQLVAQHVDMCDRDANSWLVLRLLRVVCC